MRLALWLVAAVGCSAPQLVADAGPDAPVISVNDAAMACSTAGAPPGWCTQVGSACTPENSLCDGGNGVCHDAVCQHDCHYPDTGAELYCPPNLTQMFFADGASTLCVCVPMGSG